MIYFIEVINNPRRVINTSEGIDNTFDTIDFISIGVVSEDGREYYAENSSLPNDLILSEGIKSLLQYNVYEKKPIEEIVSDLKSFFNPKKPLTQDYPTYKIIHNLGLSNEARPTFYFYKGSYQYTTLSWAFSVLPMLGFPEYFVDMVWELERVGIHTLPVYKPSPCDNALQRAKYVKQLFELLSSN